MCAILAGKARAFLPDCRANVAMMFGLALVPIVIATGAGIDFARGMMLHQRMSEALDAAALAVGNATSKPAACSSDATASTASQQACAPLQDLAERYFQQNYGDADDSDTQGAPSKVAVTIANQSVTLSTSAQLKLTLMGIPMARTPAVSVGAKTTVVWGQTRLWVALVLDNSGSMSAGDRNGSKMDALQDAITNKTYGLLNILQGASANPGDVMVGIVPFTRSVNAGISYNGANAAFIDWAEWESQPPGAAALMASLPNVGPGDSCPFTDGSNRQKSPYGFYCVSSAANGASRVSSIPSSGLICPGIDSGTYNKDHNDRYYNGCYTSDPSTKTTNGTPSTTPICSNSSNCTTNNYCRNYPQSYTSTSGHSSTVTTVTCGCNGSGNRKSCSTTSSPVTTTTTFTHAWTVNSHSTWSGCVMDRQQKNYQTRFGSGSRTPSKYDYDETNTAPSSSGSPWDDSQFPAENPASCPTAAVVTLSNDWTNLASKVNAMKANGSTNQAIGVAHGWQLLTTGAPYATGAFPAGTGKVLILFSDGLNTQNRWVGDGSTEGSDDDKLIDARMKATCTAAKADKVTIYAIFVHIGTNGSSDALENCASDDSKYYDLTSSAQIKDAFSDIAQKITSLYVSR